MDKAPSPHSHTLHGLAHLEYKLHAVGVKAIHCDALDYWRVAVVDVQASPDEEPEHDPLSQRRKVERIFQRAATLRAIDKEGVGKTKHG